MKTITEQDVLKAFYRFDCQKLPVMDINGNLSPSLDVMMRKNMCAEWMDAFDGLEAEVFEKAVQIALKKCKKYPSLSEMFEFIALADGGVEVETKPAPVQKTVPYNMLRGERIEAIVAAAKQGDFKTAQKYAELLAKSKAEITQYAKEVWPDACDAWILENWLAIGMLYAQERSCQNCGSARRCRTYGYRLTARNKKPEGELTTVMVPCYMRKRESNENLQ